VDLRDLWRPGRRLTWRRLGVMVRHLPPESATKTALRNGMTEAEYRQASQGGDPSQGQWSHTDMLLASLIDAVRRTEYVMIRVNGGKGKPPEPFPRPGASSRPRRRISEKQAEFLYRWINGPDSDPG
jgi:hypothetical protein